MSELPTFIQDLTLILIVAGVVTLLFKRLKQPLVLGYVVAGFIVSPHMPYTMSVIDNTSIHVWADIGVMFLLFSLGLDFSFKKITKMGTAPIITTCTIIFCMMASGIVVGKAFGWNRMDCIFLGGMLAMSSTTIIYKAFSDMGLRQQQFAGPVMSVLILEDVLAIVMMVMLSAIAVGQNPDGGEMLGIVVKIGVVLVLWFIVGIFLVPWLLRSVRKLANDETLLVVALALCCLMAVLSTKFGFSSAFGAFVMGSILAETVEAEHIERLVEPVKNLFGAIFFVSVGMLVEPEIIVDYALPIAVLVLTILVGQAVFGTFGFLLGGQTLRSAMRCGFSMAQIGEFSFIIASLGLSLGVTGKFLYPVVVAVSVITTFLTPYMIKFAVPCYGYVERKLSPRWVSALNAMTLAHPAKPHTGHWHSLLMQMARNTLIYCILSAAVIALVFTFILPILRGLLPELRWLANALSAVLTVVAISPFLRAMVMKKNHSEEWKALWTESRRNRLPLLFTILVRMVVAGGFVFYVCHRLTPFTGALVMSLAAVVVIFMMVSRSLKHSSIKMERMFLLNLRSRDIVAEVRGRKRPLYEGRLLDRDIHIGDFLLPENSTWGGKTLRELNLGRRFGVMVSSILRGRQRINIPGGDTVLFPGDHIQAIGSDSQLATFQKTMEGDLQPEDPDIEKRLMELHCVTISKHSPFAGKTLRESGIRDHYGCMVVGIEEGKENLSLVKADYRFKSGDQLWVVGENEAVERLMSDR